MVPLVAVASAILPSVPLRWFVLLGALATVAGAEKVRKAMATEKATTDPILEFCIAHALKREGNYLVYRDGDVLPEDYGSYLVYDGADFIGGGSTRNLAAILESYRYRLSPGSLVFFIWNPDTDGSVCAWMNQSGDEDDEDDEDCPYCYGTGLA
jgi:hypothetical protein